MKAVLSICALAFAAMFAADGATRVKRPQFEVVELLASGTNVPAYPGTLRINNSNQISGAISVVEPNPHFESFLWKDGESIQWLGEGRIDDLNDNGEFAGSVQGAVLVGNGGSFKTFAINNARQVAGSIQNRAFITDSNGQMNFPLGDAIFSQARSLNSMGAAAGMARMTPGGPITPIIFNPTNVIDLGWIRRTSMGDTTIINDQGHVLFTVTQTNRSRVRSYFFRGGRPRPLPARPGARHTVAFAMNNSDEIVGFLGRDGDSAPPGGGTAVSIVGGFLYSRGKLYQLDKLLTEESRGWHVSEALDINNAGSIAAFAARPGERRVPVLLRRVQPQAADISN
jgi:hypothetical protein